MKTMILAANQQGVIGNANQLPWHLPADLRRFKELTLHKAIIMGSNTWRSLGRALPMRHNIVLSRTLNNLNVEALPADTKISLVRNLQAAYKLAGTEVMIIGGANIYRQALEDVDKILLTEVDLEVAGDAYMPYIDPAKWHKTILSQAHQPALTQKDGSRQRAFDYRYIELTRIKTS